MAEWQRITGGVTAPKGYRAAGIAAGLKPSGYPDLALIVSDVEAIAAGVFTTSQVVAACITYCRDRLQNKPTARAVLCNAGQANAATGEQGWADALESAEIVGQALGLHPSTILLASTGVIGQPIPMVRLRAGVSSLVAALSETGSDAAAQAIITTDLVTKSVALESIVDGRTVRIGGIAKGSGMIHPTMATLLGFITCDAAVSPHLWQEMVERAANKSFNQITVDGDTSTNDALIALANGQSRTPAITEMGAAAQDLEVGLTAVCQHLARAIARDGEGATCLIEVRVSGSQDDKSANQIARTIAGSSLVKAAIFGRDPNWGRIAAAAGRAGVHFDAANLRIQLGNFVLMESGQPIAFDYQAAQEYLQAAAEPPGGSPGKIDPSYSQNLDRPVVIAVDVGYGSGQGKAWGCDLSYDYVKINAEYTT